MNTLRLTQSELQPGHYRVEAAFEGDGQPRQIATSEFEFALSPQEREDVRWYLEDYLELSADPAPKIAARIERQLAQVGTDLFKKVFHSNDDARDLWATLRGGLNETRLEIITSIEGATALPWELLRDPRTDTPLALRATAFVRAAHRAAQRPILPRVADGRVRILLVICRPGGRDDVPFRSVASRLLKGLNATTRETFQLDVLRPPTFQQLSQVLRTAHSQGQPYHVVHFDGHGLYLDHAATNTPARHDQLRSSQLSPRRAGPHGCLVFENPALADNHQLVDGLALGQLLVECEVPILVLNACRSAHAEPPPAPDSAADTNSAASDEPTKSQAFGSLAQEIVDAGVAGVVAMRYNVYVVTAAQFMADLYLSLVNGQSLGEAVTLGRKQLQAQPLRELTYTPRPLQDWMVPVVYEAAPLSLFPRPAKQAELRITITPDAVAPASQGVARELETRPDVGFFGRDETLLAIDRAFDTQSIVLLHAFAGSGKTAIVAEFARWYHFTGGVKGPVLFTSFEQKTTLAQTLNTTIGQVFASVLEKSGVAWLALSDAQRRDVALLVLQQIPVLWIWDNVEPVTGFPPGTASRWSTAEQQELADFLRAARQTKAKFLLTSRRDERPWLGDLPARISVPPMPMQERVQLAKALAEKHQRRLVDVEAWLPLLRFTEGNPLTLTVLVGQALRTDLRSNEQIASFVDQLRDGEQVFDDEASEGRSRSLGASLSYGFEHAFDETERRRLALLHLFQGSVHVGALRAMGDASLGNNVPAMRGVAEADALALLDRAAAIGLLTPRVAGFYSVHPAVPWFFRKLFERYYATAATPGDDRDSAPAAKLAYVDALARLSSLLHVQFREGQHRLIVLLEWEHANLLHALELAKTHALFEPIAVLMSALEALYSYQGRAGEWTKLLDETLPALVASDRTTPKPGAEKPWHALLRFKALDARDRKDFATAREIFASLLDHARTQTRDIPPDAADFTPAQRRALDELNEYLFQTGTLQWQARDEASFASLEEAFALSQRLGERSSASSCAFHLGHAYSDIPARRDVDRAEQWYKTSIELGDRSNPLKHALRLHELGQILYQRLTALLRSNAQPDLAAAAKLLTQAVGHAHEALKILPRDASSQRMHLHHLLGNLYDDTGHIPQALENYREAIRLSESREAFEDGARYCRELARCLLKANRLPDALAYARESLNKLARLGAGAAESVARSQQLVQLIERLSAQAKP